MLSALYDGRVQHARVGPPAHAFGYRVRFAWLDLDELPELFARRGLAGWRRLVRFRREDYLGPSEHPLREAVLERVEAELGRRPDGPVRLLTQLRVLGYVFNPVSFYYCFDAAGALSAVVAEITNTPWGERHAYVLDAAGAREGDELVWRFPKRFHVSPFFGMAQEYEWRFGVPGESLSISMTNREGGERVFSAGLACRRRPLPTRGPAGPLLRAAPLSLRVHAAIYWQALRLWWKRAPFHVHPKKRASLGDSV